MVQMLVEAGDVAANLARAEARIAEAAEAGCQIAVLPECLDFGWTFPGARSGAEPIPGRSSDTIVAAAVRAGIHVVAGMVERAGDRLYNSAILVSPDGQILWKHRKINELAVAHDLYSTGGLLGVVETGLGVIGVNICADNFPRSLALAHAQARMGCQILLSPCAWAVDGDHDNAAQPYGSLWINSYREIARLYHISVVGVSNVGWLTDGPWKGRKCIGCSLAVGPDGTILAQGPYGESAEILLTVEVPLGRPAARGTELAGYLESKGYTGP